MNIIIPDDINRAFPIILFIINLVLSISYKLPFYNIFNFYFNFKINNFLKNNVFKKIMGNSKLQILGYGKRPNGAMNCGNFRNDFFNSSIKSKLSKSYGFPSGHSQTAGYFIAFIYNNFNNNYYILIPSLIYSIYSAYSRVTLGCHTIEQVIFGYLFGIISYYLLKCIYLNFMKFINKIKFKKIS
jgi:membrane-associated phospholipid phosphatase